MNLFMNYEYKRGFLKDINGDQRMTIKGDF